MEIPSNVIVSIITTLCVLIIILIFYMVFKTMKMTLKQEQFESEMYKLREKVKRYKMLAATPQYHSGDTKAARPQRVTDSLTS